MDSQTFIEHEKSELAHLDEGVRKSIVQDLWCRYDDASVADYGFPYLLRPSLHVLVPGQESDRRRWDLQSDDLALLVTQQHSGSQKPHNLFIY